MRLYSVVIFSGTEYYVFPMVTNTRIQELETLIKKHQDLYYNAEPEISDADFDCLWDELRAIDPENALFQTVPQESAERARPI